MNLRWSNLGSMHPIASEAMTKGKAKSSQVSRPLALTLFCALTLLTNAGSAQISDNPQQTYTVTVITKFSDNSAPEQCEVEVYPFDDKEVPLHRSTCQSKIPLKAGRYDFRVIVSESGYLRERWINSKLIQGDSQLSTTFPEREASITILTNILSADNSYNPLERVVVLLEHSQAMLANFDEFTLQQRALQFLEELRGHTEHRNLPLHIFLYSGNVSKAGSCVSKVTEVQYQSNQAFVDAVTRVPSGEVASAEDALRVTAERLTGKHGNLVILVTSGRAPCGDSLCAGLTQMHPYADQFRLVHFGLTAIEDCASPRLLLGDSQQIEGIFDDIAQMSMSTIGMITIYQPNDHTRPIAYGLLGRRVLVPKGNYDVVIRRGDEKISWSNFPIRRHLRAQIDEGSISLLP